MFERLVIRQRSAESFGAPIDVGVIAEALLFYAEVLVVADYPTLRSLTRAVPPDVLCELIIEGHLRLVYEAERLAILTHDLGKPSERHDAIYYSAPKHRLEVALPELLVEATGQSGKGRRLARRLLPRIESFGLSAFDTEAARSELADAEYVRQSVQILMQRLAPGYRGPADLVVSRDGGLLRVTTNIDFTAANHVYNARIPAEHSSLSSHFLLAHLLNVKTDLLIAARSEAELSIDDTNAEIIRATVRRVLADAPSRQAATKFQDFVFDDGRAVAEACRSGQISMADVARLMPHAMKFKEWLRRENVQADVVKAYFRDVTRDTWVERLPTKSVRWALFTAAGAGIDSLGGGGVGTAAAVMVSAVDAFVLDCLIRGWKPSQFIDRLRPFMKQDRSR